MNHPARKLSAILIMLWVGIFCHSMAENDAVARTFTQEANGRDDRGYALPMVDLNPANLPGFQQARFSFSDKSFLEIHHNLPADRAPELSDVAGVVQRCFQSLEQKTGRRLTGGVLLYILHYPERPRAFRFHAEVSDDAPWKEIRVAFVQGDEPLLGPGSSPHLSTLLYDTLPHELGHDLLAAQPTVRHDGWGAPPVGTRWFIDGVCELLAKDFAREENPEAWQRALSRRRVETLEQRPYQGAMVYSWGMSEGYSPLDESDLYGWAYRLVQCWDERFPLAELLKIMVERGGGFDGEGLEELLRETAGLTGAELLAKVRFPPKNLTYEKGRPRKAALLSEKNG